jgi:aminodeoxyfutalosine deaminase
VTPPSPAPPAPLDRFAVRMPKVELHVHLEGSMRPAVLLALARRNGVALPADDEAGLKRWFRFKSFDQFVDVYLTCSRSLKNPEDFQLLALDVMAEQAVQNVVYSEIHFTISTHVAAGAAGGEVRQALDEALREGEARYGVTMKLIPDIVRNMDRGRADVTLEWALAGQGGPVVALGLSGIEAGYSNEPFRDHFAAAAAAGLHRVVHAGEHAGPESVRSALAVCQPERIGHGVRSSEDPALVAELAARGLPLEVCPSSNVCLGVVPSLAGHPFDRLRRGGAVVTVNSDDPPFFDTNLTREYLRLAETFGYDAADLAGFSLAALRHAFLPEERRTALEADFRRQFAELGSDLYGARVEPRLTPAV